jgi:cytochrome P450
MRYLLFVKQTVSAMTTLFYVMAMNPQVLKKAQEELDRVVGTDRLPAMSDLDQLPYINAVIKEVLRWNPPLPLGTYT